MDITDTFSFITPGENSHLLLSILVKHLDHKNVVKQPHLQINILNVTTQLAKRAKQQASVAIIGALTDLVKYLRKCLQNQSEASNRESPDNCNSDIQTSLERCISQLSDKVGVCLSLFLTLNLESLSLFLEVLLYLLTQWWKRSEKNDAFE